MDSMNFHLIFEDIIVETVSSTKVNLNPGPETDSIHFSKFKQKMANYG